MHCFETPTQYDKQYLGMDNNHNVCPVFSLMIAFRFLSIGDVSHAAHLNMLDAAVSNYLEKNISGQIAFDELLAYVEGLDDSSTNATTPELIKENILGWDTMLPEKNEPYAVVFLKSNRYFTVMHKEGIYYLRDANEPFQYDFNSRDELIKHINERHQFDTEIKVDGFVVGEFSNIEFLILDKEYNHYFNMGATANKKDDKCVNCKSTNSENNMDTSIINELSEDEELQRAIEESLHGTSISEDDVDIEYDIEI